MSDDVVDIRKRIEEMRNEVSAAIVSGREQAQATRALGELADIAISSNMEPGDVNGWKKTKAPSDTMVHTHRSIDNALKERDPLGLTGHRGMKDPKESKQEVHSL